MSNIQKVDGDLENFIANIHKKRLKSFLEDTYLITLNVAGLYYNDNILEIFPKLKKKDRLELYRQQDNEFDKYAILVKFNGEKLGYVPRSDNKILANLMDAGKEIYGEIVDLNMDKDPYNQIHLFVKFKIFLKED